MTAIKPPVHLFSTLPHVLEEYIPDYKPKHEARPSLAHSEEFDEPTQEKQGQSKDEKRKKQSEVVKEELKQRPAYSGHSKRHRLSEDERHEQLSQRWDEAKSEVRSSQNEKLKEKIELQHLLIRRQDVLAQQKRDKIRQDIEQKRESDKTKRQQKEAALQEKCKASLEEDRKVIQQERQNKSKEVRISQSNGSTAATSSPTSPAGPRHGSFQPALPPLSRTPSNLEINDMDKTKPWTPSSMAELEWYQSQLYQMFGNEADTFLHPKMEQQVKKPTNPKLAKQGGRAGAERLWDTLRKESIIRLLKEDAHIEQDLKDTYSAFVRESIGTNRKIVRRNFYAHDDVPELGRLLDQSQLNAMRTNKHKVDIMYRASINNMDRTNILTHNFPLPLSEEGERHDKKESCVARYLPSWMDDASEASIPEYTKWLPKDPQKDVQHPEDPSENKENQDPWKKEEMDDELLLLMTRSRKRVPQPKYIFLTEKEARVKGKFADKFKDEREYKDIPRPYMGGAKSVMGVISTPANADKRAESAPLPQKHLNNYETFLTPWEPLSMKALVEYKTQLDTQGDGEFNQGRTKTWKTEVKAT